MGSRWLSSLPLDIWYLVCQELAAGAPEFNALFNLALASRALAGVALPALWGVQHAAWIYRPDLSNAGNVCLWRSLALSSLGKSAFPYASWIRVIELGSLRGMLDEIGRTAHMREAFFDGDMDVFHPRHMEPALFTRSGGWANLSVVQMDLITIRIGEAITSSVRDGADRSNKITAVAELESYQLPVEVLTAFIARLTTLRTLTLRTGSILDQRVGRIIRESCPSFREVCCYFCLGHDGDEKMAGFLLALGANTLQRFGVISSNRLGQHTFTALARHHPRSLRMLHLSSLPDPAVPHLPLLSPCAALESLSLECHRLAEGPPDLPDEDWLEQVGAWLSNSPSLATLCIDRLPGLSILLSSVLVSSRLRLKTLSVNLDDAEVHDGFFAAIGSQPALEDLCMLSRTDPYEDDFEPLVQSVLKCKGLVRLMLYNSLTGGQVREICASLPRLEKLRFDGEHMPDAVLSHLLLAPRLNSVDVNATSCFTTDGILDLIRRLAEDGKGAHHGFALSLLSQMQTHRFTQDEVNVIEAEIRSKLGGTFSLVYFITVEEEDANMSEDEFVFLSD